MMYACIKGLSCAEIIGVIFYMNEPENSLKLKCVIFLDQEEFNCIQNWHLFKMISKILLVFLLSLVAAMLWISLLFRVESGASSFMDFRRNVSIYKG